VEFLAYRKFEVVRHEEASEVYVDQLREIIEDRTGLDLSLGTMGVTK
jgi:hypothetical protein